MTLRVIEGFDHMSSVGLMAAKNWAWETEEFGPSFWHPGFTTGRINGKAFSMTSPNLEVLTGRFYKTLPSVQTSFVVAFSFMSSQMPPIGNEGPFFALWLNNGTMLIRFYIDANGLIALYNSSSALLAQTATGLFTASAWHNLETKIVVNGASSSVGMHLNGVEVIPATTVNLGSTGVQFAGPYAISNSGWSSDLNNDTGVTLTYDDLWLADTAGGDVSDFIGDAHVETLFPNGEGTHSDWTPNAGTVHYNRVNERTGTYPDGDTTYLKALTAGLIDTWQYDDLSITTGTVYGVQTNLYARKEDSNLRQLYPQIVSGGTTYTGSTLQTLASGYVDSTEIFEENPDTSAPWTVPEVNAAEFGVLVET